MTRKRKPSGVEQTRGRSITSYNRRSGNKSPNQLILIVCGGEETEPLYFEELRRRFRLTSVQIKGHNRDPKYVVEYALEALRNLSCSSAWCVLDVETATENEKSLRSALSLATSHPNIHIALSNPAFEFWYLLHFVETTRPFHNAIEVVKELERYLPHPYKKNFEGFNLIFPLTNLAIERAVRILNSHIDQGNAPNPSTRVHVLVELLKSMAD